MENKNIYFIKTLPTLKDRILDLSNQIIQNKAELKGLAIYYAGNLSSILNSKYRNKFLYDEEKKLVWFCPGVDCKAEPFESFYIKIVFHFVGNPLKMIGKKKLTDSELKIVTELNKRWQNDICQGRYCFAPSLYENATQLLQLKHGIDCHRTSFFHMDLADIAKGEFLYAASYHFKFASTDLSVHDFMSFDDAKNQGLI